MYGPYFCGCHTIKFIIIAKVITAVFCESAIESAQSDQFTVVQSILADKENHLQKAMAREHAKPERFGAQKQRTRFENILQNKESTERTDAFA